MNDEPKREDEVPARPEGMSEGPEGEHPTEKKERQAKKKRRSLKELCILEALLETKLQIETEQLIRRLHEECDTSREEGRQAIEDYLEELVRRGYPVEWTEQHIAVDFVAFLKWWETKVGQRVLDHEGMQRKAALADAVVDLLVGKRDLEQASGSQSMPSDGDDKDMQVIYLSSGATLYSVCLAVVRRMAEVRKCIRTIYTASQIALDVLAWRGRPHDVRLIALGGEFERGTGSLKTEDHIGSIADKIRDLPLDLVVVSFNGLDNKGFWTDEPWEADQLLALLDCGKEKDRLALIPLEWSKINQGTGTLLKITDLLDRVAQSGSPTMRYVIVTDPPDGNLKSNPAKENVLQEWAKKGIKVLPVKPTA